MIEKTVFENQKEIIDYVNTKYGLNISKINKINKGSANIYLLNDKYILKEFQSKYSKEEIDKEVIIINHLRKHNIKVPEYIKTLAGKYSDTYKEKTIIIQKYIKGYTLDKNQGNYQQTIECAEYYGKIVNALKNLLIDLPSSDISNWYSKDSFTRSIQKHKHLLSLLKNNETDNKIKKDILEKISMLETIRNNYNFTEMKNLTILGTHGDYNVLQFIYKNGKINSVIDFVSACKMPVVWELIRSYSYIDKDAKNGSFNLKTFIDYVKMFNKYIKLNKYDIKYMPYLYLIQILNSTFGYKQYIESKNMDLLQFGCLRTNICRYLFDNAELISDTLKKEL